MKPRHVLIAIAVGMAFAALHAFSRGMGYGAAHAIWRHL
jgi:hypothetical protein